MTIVDLRIWIATWVIGEVATASFPVDEVEGNLLFDVTGGWHK